MDASLHDLRPAARDEVAALAENFVALMRTFTKAKARLLSAAEKDVEWSAHLVLRSIATGEGPMRAAALAEHLQSDPSTVSRQVAALVRDGYLVREADPGDGRASLLVLTPKADQLLAEHDRIRLEFFEQVVAGWSDADLSRFTGLLDRFTQAYEAVNNQWMSEGIGHRSRRAGSRH